MTRTATPLLLVLALLLAACGGEAGADRDAALANLTSGSDALSQVQAQCVVDGTSDEQLAQFDNFSEEFQTTADPESDPDLADLIDVIFGCVLDDIGSELEGLGDIDLDDLDLDALSDEALAELGAGASGAPIDCDQVDGPCEYGDDADLDALWDGCEAGDGEACDDLFLQSPLGSRYEEFGNTCGDRGSELTCADVYQQ